MQEFEKYPSLVQHISRMASTGHVGGGSDWSKFIEDLNQVLQQCSVMRAEGRTVAAPSVEETINRLGECSEGNEYRIYPYDGKWWIDHKHVGSGEPLEQFLRGGYGA